MATKKQCLECGDPLTGREDKRFCSDQCRSAHHNKFNSDETNYIRNVNNTLRKNRRILLGLNPDGKTRVHRDKLLIKGFKFNYFTNEYVTRNGNTYRFCYDQGYMITEDDYVTLVIKKDYVE